MTLSEILVALVPIGLLAIIALRALRGRSAPVPSRPRSTRPADGVVELVATPGFKRGTNPSRVEIGPFEAVETGATSSFLPRGRSAPPLLGEVVLWQLFIGRDGKEWSDEEIALAYEATERASVWLEEQAGRRGAPLNLKIPETYFAGLDEIEEEIEIGFQNNGEEVGPREGDAEIRVIASAARVAARLGFGSFVELVELARGSIEADEHAWLVHVRRKGQSFAIPPDDSPIPGLTLACCYLREASFSEPLKKSNLGADPVTVAHELLHLFGASDKYGRPLDAFPKGSLSSRDIMRLSVERLSQLRVDNLTASEIGWPEIEAESPKQKQPPRPPKR